MGLQWGDIDFSTGTILVQRQLQRDFATKNGTYLLLNKTKNGKNRLITIAPSISKLLQTHYRHQAEAQLAAGALWDNPHDLVFTNAFGRHLNDSVVRKHFKKIVSAIGRPEVRFHDLRHSYATNALQSGDSIKAVQEQLGHYSSAFTMDTYADVSAKMRQESQSRMENFYQSVTEN